jgi:uncharacterized protein (TIGR02996 family)
MNKDEAFCQAIRKNPADDSLRLVYADWLEERDDPRGEYLRLSHALDELPLSEERADEYLPRLRELQGAIDPQWLALVSAGRVSLIYHRKAFALTGEKPVLSKTNVQAIEKWERQSGEILPASLREWYSLEGAEERLRGAVDGYSPTSLQNALNNIRELPSTPPTTVFPVGYWEEFGPGCQARLDGSQDPPVDNADERSSDPFSIFAFCRVWGKLTRSAASYLTGFHRYSFDEEFEELEQFDEFPLLAAREPSFGKTDIGYLAKHFSEGFHRTVQGRQIELKNPSTGEPLYLFGPVSVVRFFSPTVRIQIMCKGNPRKRSLEADWDISANSTQDLVEAVAQHLWNRGTLAQTLRGRTRAGKNALRTLRRRFPKTE